MEPAFISRYRERFESTWNNDAPVDHVRFVVLNQKRRVSIPGTIDSSQSEASAYGRARSPSTTRLTR